MHRFSSIFFTYFKRTRCGLDNLKNHHFNRLLGKQRMVFNNFNYKYGKVGFPVVLFSLVSFWSDSNTPKVMSSDSAESGTKSRQEAITKADEVFTANKHEEVCQILLPYKDSGDVEILWRIARSKYKISSQQNINKTVKEAAIHEGFDAISKALEIDKKNFAVHKWMSVLLDAKSELLGIKERITQLKNVKDHMLEAVELNPNDATTYHMLGSWCYQIADMAWYQRTLASTLFASPPTSTYQEALQYFKQAEEVQPNFYSQNLLMLGKTYQKLGEQERAYYYLKLTTEYLVSSDDDLMARKEAETLLQKLNYKP